MKFAVLLSLVLMSGGNIAAAGESTAPKLMSADEFPQLEKVEGKGWSLVCAAVEGDYAWGPVLRVGSEERYRPRDSSATRKEGVRYLLWPTSKESRWLCVYLGENRSNCLDVFDMKNGFKHVLSSEGEFQFTKGAADLNGDGNPEFVGMSEGFCSVSTMPWDFCTAEEPRPVAIMAYEPKSDRYRSAAFLFPDYTAKICAEWEARFCDGDASLGLKGFSGRYNSEILKNKYSPPSTLVWWLLELVYSGREDEAWATLDKYCEPDVAKAIRDGIEVTLKKDNVYQDMLRYQKEKGKP
jgi:hypothetical protein